VERAEERLKEKGLAANLAVLDMRKNFPYKDEVFDAIVTIRVIHHALLQVIKKTIAEIKRTLKKVGYFYAEVPSRPRNLHDDNSKRKIVEPRTRIPLEGPEKGIPHHDFTEKEIYQVLRDFEIQEIRKKDSHFHILAKKKS
jgi:ubiquinone/menaquinone biosynthesis C-methylase UbiE